MVYVLAAQFEAASVCDLFTNHHLCEVMIDADDLLWFVGIVVYGLGVSIVDTVVDTVVDEVVKVVDTVVKVVDTVVDEVGVIRLVVVVVWVGEPGPGLYYMEEPWIKST